MKTFWPHKQWSKWVFCKFWMTEVLQRGAEGRWLVFSGKVKSVETTETNWIISLETTWIQKRGLIPCKPSLNHRKLWSTQNRGENQYQTPYEVAPLWKIHPAQSLRHNGWPISKSLFKSSLSSDSSITAEEMLDVLLEVGRATCTGNCGSYHFSLSPNEHSCLEQ